jgi:hypothetical protein
VSREPLFLRRNDAFEGEHRFDVFTASHLKNNIVLLQRMKKKMKLKWKLKTRIAKKPKNQTS